MNNEQILEVFGEHGLYSGRMVSPSKSSYHRRNKTHVTVFNANVITWNGGKVWFGDLDLTVDGQTLKEIADKIKEPLYVLYEMDARFGEENRPIEVLVGKAMWDTTKEILGEE